MIIYFIKNVFNQYLSNIVLMFSEFFSMILILKYIGEEGLGILSFSYAVNFIIFQCLDFRITEGFITFFSQYKLGKETRKMQAFLHFCIFLEAARGIIGLFIGLVCAFFILPKFYDFPNLTLIMSLGGAAAFFNNIITSTGRGILRALDKFHISGLLSAFPAVLKLLGIYFLKTYYSLTVINILIITVFSYFLMSLLYYKFINKEIEPILGFKVKMKNFDISFLRKHINDDLKRFAVFSKNLYIASLSMIPTKELDITILSMFCALEIVGAYKVAKNFLGAFWTLIDSISLVFYTKLSVLVHEKTKYDIKKFIFSITVIMTILGIFLYFSGFFMVPKLVGLFLEVDSNHVSYLFNIMAIGILFWSPFFWLNSYILSIRKSNIILKSSIYSAIILVFLYFLLGYMYSDTGVSIATALSSPLVVLLVLTLSKRSSIWIPLTLPRNFLGKDTMYEKLDIGNI